jgi:hypothetical protein
MIVLVCGGRSFHNYENVEHYLDMLHAVHQFDLVIHGAAIGADQCADRWAHRRCISCHKYPAQWKMHGRSAGPIRNKQMLLAGKPDLVVAFPGGRGTRDMRNQSIARGVKLVDLASAQVRALVEAQFKVMDGHIRGAARAVDTGRGSIGS